jgi:putative tryptophan/tyrosine transport system substrate-binding protein
MRFQFLALLLANAILAPIHLAEAQQPTKIPRIGFIASVGPEAAPNVEPFRRGLRELGYIEGKTSL